MATKAPAKAVSKSTAVAVKKPTSGALVSIREQLAAQAADTASRTAPPTGSKVQLKGGKFKFPDGTETAGPVRLVIVDFVTTHAYYPGKFDANNIQPPECFAIGTNPKAMLPSPHSPNIQAKDCQTCQQNQFESSGKGKACKNGRKLAVLPPGADADTPIWTMDVSPTAIKGFDAYVQSVARMFQTPPVGVVTTVAFDDTVDYTKLVFSNPEPNEDLEVCFGRQEEARTTLETEPDVSGYQAPAGKKPLRTPVKAR